MVGYGFYGDVLAESERHRWMGPLRYDYSGILHFMCTFVIVTSLNFLSAPYDALTVFEGDIS